MTGKKLPRLLALLLCLSLLGGCAPTPDGNAPSAVLPAAPEAPIAPVGDAGLYYTAMVPMYLPSLDGQQLLTFYETLTFTYTQHPAEAIVRALLNHPGNERVQRPGNGATLSLYGANPVEVAGGVCTVNLTPSALQLSRQDLYTLALALSATLCELPDVTHVNLLAASVPVAMDVSGCLPLGAVPANTAQELPVLWDQLSARRTPAGEKPAFVPLTTNAALYFPLSDGSGVTPEVRRLSFAGQHPQQLVQGLLDALIAGPEQLGGAAALPDLNALSMSVPEITELDSGGLGVTLHFTGDIRSRMTDAGVDPACGVAAIVTTLTTFVPNLQQVCILTGNGALTSVYNARHGSLLFPGGVHHREDYASFLQARTTLFAIRGARLARCEASLPYRHARDPRTLLLTLASLTGEGAPLPEGLTDADVLGVSIAEGTLTINLSERYAGVIRDNGMDQRLMAYALVNTMCANLPVSRVMICFGGKAMAELGQSLLWNGEFLYNPGLILD